MLESRILSISASRFSELIQCVQILFIQCCLQHCVSSVFWHTHAKDAGTFIFLSFPRRSQEKSYPLGKLIAQYQSAVMLCWCSRCFSDAGQATELVTQIFFLGVAHCVVPSSQCSTGGGHGWTKAASGTRCTVTLSLLADICVAWKDGGTEPSFSQGGLETSVWNPFLKNGGFPSSL